MLAGCHQLCGSEVICESERVKHLGLQDMGEGWNSCCGEGNWESAGAKNRQPSWNRRVWRALQCSVISPSPRCSLEVETGSRQWCHPGLEIRPDSGGLRRAAGVTMGPCGHSHSRGQPGGLKFQKGMRGRWGQETQALRWVHVAGPN